MAIVDNPAMIVVLFFQALESKILIDQCDVSRFNFVPVEFAGKLTGEESKLDRDGGLSGSIEFIIWDLQVVSLFLDSTFFDKSKEKAFQRGSRQ